MKAKMKQQTIKVGILLLGMRQRVVLQYLQAHGFTDADLDEGWRLFNTVGRLRRGNKGRMIDKERLTALDRFENYWFPIVRLVLERHYPDFVEALFAGLVRSSGKAASWNVGFFLDRLQALENGDAPFNEDGPAARELLSKRGLSSEVITSVTESLVALRTMESAEEVEISEEERAAAEAAMLEWYKEWSGIALRVIPNRNILRSLSLGRRGPARAAAEEEVVEELPTLAAASALPALPAHSENGSMTAAAE